jgi:hypothetical protein
VVGDSLLSSCFFLSGFIIEELTEALKQLENEKKLSENAAKDLRVNNLSDPAALKSLHITPEPAFSYKTYRTKDSRKVFINITSHELLEKPGIKKKLNKEGEEIEGINIPISVGMPREEKDKKEQSCLIYDLIVNPEVIEECSADKTGKYRDFICQLGIQSLEQKYREDLDKKYKLPKLKYFGSAVPEQLIQDRKNMPKIEEVIGNAGQKKGNTATASKQKSSSSSVTTPVIPETEKDLTQITASWLASKDSTLYSSSSVLQLLKESKEYLSSPGSSSSLSSWIKSSYDSEILSEYIDPVTPIPLLEDQFPSIGFVLEIEFSSYLPLSSLSSLLQLQLSPFKLSIKLPGYKKWVGYYPLAIQPAYSYYFVIEMEGFVSQKKLIIFSFIDKTDFASECDPGSKPWLVSQALSDENDDVHNNSSSRGLSNPYRRSSSSRKENFGNVEGETSSSSFPEDKFHIPLPDDVDPYTGMQYDYPVPTSSSSSKPAAATATKEEIEEQELPEDRFHRKDAGSQFILQQREQTKKDKWEKYEK